MMLSSRLSLAVLSLVLFAPGTALAVDATGPRLSVTGPQALAATPGAPVGNVGRFDGALIWSFADVTAQAEYPSGTVEELVTKLNSFDLSLAYTPLKRFRIEGYVPLHTAATGGGILGDMSLAGQYRLNASGKSPGSVAGRVVLGIPTGDQDAMLGGPFNVGLLVVGTYAQDRWGLTGMAGPQFGGGEDLYGVHFGSAFLLSGGAHCQLTNPIDIGAEVVSRFYFPSNDDEVLLDGTVIPAPETATPPVEAILHMDADLGPIGLRLLGGTALSNGVSAPHLLIGAGLTYTAGAKKEVATTGKGHAGIQVSAHTANGRVIDAQVKVVGTDIRREVTLGNDGSETVTVPPGHYKVVVNADSYGTRVREVDVTTGHPQVVDFTLSASKVNVTDNEIKILEPVHFAVDSDQVLPDSMALLDDVAAVMQSRTSIRKLEVQGHTDATGDTAYNLALSQRRVESVVEILVAKGVERSRLLARGYGETRPIAANSTEAGRAENRRVQFVITEKGQGDGPAHGGQGKGKGKGKGKGQGGQRQ